MTFSNGCRIERISKHDNIAVNMSGVGLCSFHNACMQWRGEENVHAVILCFPVGRWDAPAARGFSIPLITRGTDEMW